MRDNMAIGSAPSDGDGYGDLLPKTSNTFLQMTALARKSEHNPEIRIFYSHIESYCLRLQDHATRALQLASQLNSELVNKVLNHLASLIRSEALQPLPLYDSVEFRLGLLNLAWNEARKQDEAPKLDFVRQWLSLELPKQRQDGVDKALEICVDEFDRQQPEDAITKPSGKSLSPDLDEPSHAVWKAAQSIFDALLSCKGCSCPHQHDFQAKLELGTYRKLEKKTDKKHAAKPRNRARKTRGGGDEDGQLDFDMFLSMERDWREIRVQTAKEKGVSFQIQGEVASACISTTADGHSKVEELCNPISSAKAKHLRLLLKLSSGHLFKMGVQKTNFEVDRTAESISLTQCFEHPGEFFTETTKRILSLIVGYTVFHLHGTAWLQPGWGSANIKFFKTKTKMPMRPFIQTQLSSAHCADAMSPLGLVVSRGDDDDDTLDELYSEHKCPELVSLAVVLMEIYFTKPFKILADEHDIELIDDPSGRIAPVNVDQVFYGDEESGKEEWRYHIPENYPLLEAIDNCPASRSSADQGRSETSLAIGALLAVGVGIGLSAAILSALLLLLLLV
ncbi:hypothetical protein BKA56DRAFT_603453 [Ilyonectria sp. MPI-CAGE-AT-0026]|nr:hypothetical protein BKA56DRAFT_603453 [Ilyonectria sp. MPI-CAGE-AT-0026]